MNIKELAKSNQVATSNHVVSPLSRLAGPAAILAGALFIVSQLALLTLDRTDRVAASTTMTFKISMAGYVTGFVVLVIALVALYQRQALQTGTLGVVAFCAAVAGTMDMAGNQWFDGFVAPWLAQAAPETFTAPKTGTLIIAALSSYLLLPIGWVLFAIASFRAGVYPRILCVTLMIGGLISYGAGLPPYGIPLGVAVAALGVWSIARPEANLLKPMAAMRPQDDTEMRSLHAH
jgi:hypothetical protein